MNILAPCSRHILTFTRSLTSRHIALGWGRTLSAADQALIQSCLCIRAASFLTKIKAALKWRKPPSTRPVRLKTLLSRSKKKKGIPFLNKILSKCRHSKTSSKVIAINPAILVLIKKRKHQNPTSPSNPTSLRRREHQPKSHPEFHLK